MPNYRMQIAFNGAHYAGWQRQPGLPTVQQAVEDTLRNLFSDPRLTVCSSSRTDAGVHALDLTLSFQTACELPESALAGMLKRRLPHDIRLLRVQPANASFHAHKSALGKAYVYVFHTGEPDIFLNPLCWNWPGVPLTEEVRRMVRILPGRHDFRSFTGRHAEVNTIRTLYRVELIEMGPFCCFYISGNGFLYKMVRRLAGFLYETAQGKHTVSELEQLLRNPIPPADDVTVAPPEGLFLKKVFYEPGEWENDHPSGLPFLPEPGKRFSAALE